MENRSTSVAWWLGWIAITILSFFASCYFWTGFIAQHAGTMDKSGVPALWITAVFGSWMVLLVPLIIVMYNKVDKAYEDARLARESVQLQKARQDWPSRSISVDSARRLLKKELIAKLKKMPETIKRGHLVNITLKNGQKISNIFIADKREVLGVYAATTLAFDIQDIIDLEPVPDDAIPNFKAEEWLRLDGVGEKTA